MSAGLARIVLILCTILCGLLALARADAAELVMFEQKGCPWCAVFDREVAAIYAKTPEGARAPLRRVDIAKPLPRDLAFIRAERMTPVFVLIDGGREIGRIRGYPGEDHFWGLLGELIARLDEVKRTSALTSR
jgi:thioredoxin-related protein